MPSATLLITTCNRGRLLKNSLERLAQLTVPDEVLVIDDGGTDETEQVCAEFTGRLPIGYLYHDNPGASICSFARNVGLRNIDTDLVITSEPEVAFQTDVIAQLAALHDQHPNDVISAGTIFFARADSVPWESAHSGSPDFKMEVGWVATYCGLYARDWLYEVGGWDESFPGPWGWDDTDLLTRLRISGHGQVIEPDVKVVHQWHPLGADVSGVNEQHFFGKSFHQDALNRADVVANRDRVWGALRTKSS